jgi:hypothetical protein
MASGEVAEAPALSPRLRKQLKNYGYTAQHPNVERWAWWDANRLDVVPDRDQVVAALHAGRMDEAHELAILGRLIWCLANLGRSSCDYDLNEIVLAGPWDGEEHVFGCPGCGRLVSMRFPLE